MAATTRASPTTAITPTRATGPTTPSIPGYPIAVRALSLLTLGDTDLAAIAGRRTEPSCWLLIALFALSVRYLDRERAMLALWFFALGTGRRRLRAWPTRTASSCCCLVAAFLAMERRARLAGRDRPGASHADACARHPLRAAPADAARVRRTAIARRADGCRSCWPQRAPGRLLRRTSGGSPATSSPRLPPSPTGTPTRSSTRPARSSRAPRLPARSARSTWHWASPRNGPSRSGSVSWGSIPSCWSTSGPDRIKPTYVAVAVIAILTVFLATSTPIQPPLPGRGLALRLGAGQSTVAVGSGSGAGRLRPGPGRAAVAGVQLAAGPLTSTGTGRTGSIPIE